MLRVYHPRPSARGPSTREKLETSEVGRVVASSIVACRSVPDRSARVLALGRVEVEYVKVALLRPNGNRRRAVNSPCGSKVGGDKATRSLGAELGSLDVVKAESWFP